jgi:hypothetical protein
MNSVSRSSDDESGQRRATRRVAAVVLSALVVLSTTAVFAAPVVASSHSPQLPGGPLPSGEYLVTVDFAGPLAELTVPVSFSDGSVSVGGDVDQFVLLSLLLASGGDVDAIEITTLAGREPPVSSSRALPDGVYVASVVIDDRPYVVRADVDDGQVDLRTPDRLFDALRAVSNGGELGRFGIVRTGG